MSRYEYQVSESTKADRKYFNNHRDAVALAKTLSMRQTFPVFVDVYDNNAGELTNFWYTITRGKLQKHGNEAGVK